MALACGAIMLASPIKALIVGPIGVVFFGGGAVFYAARLVRRAPELTVTDEGFVHRTWGRIEWSQVEAVIFRNIKVRGHVQPYIEAVLFDPDPVIARRPRTVRILAATNGKVGFAPVSISTTALAASTEEVLNAMKQHHQRFLDSGISQPG
jgi:hypothetical protein